jgi:hypothetical protein
MALVSPGVQVTVTDESFFIPVSAPTVPLLFIATADEKLQTNGQTPAEGTYEHSVVRTITSLKQSLDTYGLPTFLSSNGEQHHGDARNEYGLFALNQFLGIGNRAYVVRANVNLNDDLDDIRELWDGTNNATMADPGGKIQEAKTILENLVLEYINNYNTANSLILGQDALIATQTNVDYDGVVPNGTFVGGLGALPTGYVVGEVISLSNSADISVTSVDVLGDVLTFTVIAPGSADDGVTIAQLATTGVGSGFTLTPGTNNLVQFKVAVDGTELLSLMNDATQFIFDPVIGSYSFIPLATEFFADLGLNPLDVFADGYDMPSTGSFPGAEAVTTDPLTWIAYATTAVVGEWSAQEAGDTLLALADDFKYTQAFLTKTSLGLNDAARRVSIVTAFQAAINSNTDVRSENFDFNLVLCPGYPEAVDELLSLVADIQDEALVIADTPMDRSPDGITNPTTGWASTTAKVSSNHVAYYYPHVLASNLDGSNVLASASGTALRQYAYSDNVSFLWFAPAGVRRGVITGVTDVGYVTGELGGPTEFNPIALNNGQRDALYQYSASGMINPIVFFPGRGFLVFGQKTSLNVASALDRVNVSRLVKYIKRQLRRNTLPFVFEPNDQLTRDNLKAAVDNFLGDLIIKRGLYDFASVCDETNNTPDRIDRNEMYIDVAIKPVKAAEFIFIPMRVVATGAEI